jgi:hypothetical protein
LDVRLVVADVDVRRAAPARVMRTLMSPGLLGASAAVDERFDMVFPEM